MNTISLKGRQNDDLSLTGFNARLVAPYFTQIPPQIEENWVKKMIEAKGKTYRGLKKAIRTRKDFEEKIAKPTEKTIASFINPEWRSKHGLTYKDIMNKTRDSLAGAGKRYFQKRKDVFETGKYEEKLEYGRKEYARKWCKYLGPLKGYKAGNILGLSTMAIMALAGDRKLVDYLKSRNVRLEGDPLGHPVGEPLVITTPEKLGEFKKILVSLIVHWGSEIITQGYEEWVIKQANAELNQLVNEYRQSEISPFSLEGISHIDFIVVEITDPTNPNKKKKWLGLEIQVSRERNTKEMTNF
ncbi:MAG: hypothetical protein V1709_02930 [Planctomycetota bacterium]